MNFADIDKQFQAMESDSKVKAARAAKNIMAHGRVLAILGMLQARQDEDQEEFERLLDRIEEVI